MSLRTRLKKQAEADLVEMSKGLAEVARLACEDSGVDWMDLLKLAVGGRTATIRSKSVAALVNVKEIELEKLLDSQEKLDLGDLSGSGKEKK